jgi:hypothetical protein
MLFALIALIGLVTLLVASIRAHKRALASSEAQLSAHYESLCDARGALIQASAQIDRLRLNLDQAIGMINDYEDHEQQELQLRLDLRRQLQNSETWRNYHIGEAQKLVQLLREAGRTIIEKNAVITDLLRHDAYVQAHTDMLTSGDFDTLVLEDQEESDFWQILETCEYNRIEA